MSPGKVGKDKREEISELFHDILVTSRAVKLDAFSVNNRESFKHCGLCFDSIWDLVTALKNLELAPLQEVNEGPE